MPEQWCGLNGIMMAPDDVQNIKYHLQAVSSSLYVVHLLTLRNITPISAIDII